MEKMRTISRKFTSGVGFSNGWALLALKKPPPFVPSILITSCEATGPRVITCFRPSSVVTSRDAENVCGTPAATRIRPTTIEAGSSR